MGLEETRGLLQREAVEPAQRDARQVALPVVFGDVEMHDGWLHHLTGREFGEPLGDRLQTLGVETEQTAKLRLMQQRYVHQINSLASTPGAAPNKSAGG